MKYVIRYIFLLSILLTGCKANYPVAQQSGKEDMAYLLFVGQNQCGNKDILVSIDDNAPFTAKAVKAKKANRKGTQYAIGTGARNIKVTRESKTLYQKKIFVSTQEVKQIILP